MVFIDTNKPVEKPEYKPPVAGIDLWQITDVKETKSKNTNANMLRVEFKRVSMLAQKYPDRLYDNILLEGTGWGIGKAKLVAILGGPLIGELPDLVGKRVWLSTGLKGKYLNVLLSDERKAVPGDFHWSGIQNEKNPPPGHSLPEADASGDIPF